MTVQTHPETGQPFKSERRQGVTGAGRPSKDGWIPENHNALDTLTVLDDGERIGRHPLNDLTPAELTACGHPRRPSSSVVAAMRKYLDLPGDQLPEGMTSKPRYTTFREHCVACAENVAEVRRCAVVDCPFWPYRMGKNPHNPRRGQRVGQP